MAWLGIEKGKEIKIERLKEPVNGCSFSFTELPEGTIEKLTGRRLTKYDEPLKIEEDEYEISGSFSGQ